MSIAGRPHVVVVGAGFGGLSAARALARQPVRVTLLDRRNFHLFQPLLYQVATAGLEPADIAYAVRGMTRRWPNVEFRVGEVCAADWHARLLRLSDGSAVGFDHLVLAAGAVTATFGVAGVAEHAFELKTLGDAVRLRSHLLTQFERVDVRPAEADAGALTVVVVGGGPTGVEMAGSLAELYAKVLRKDFPTLDWSRPRVVLVEATDALLGAFHPSLRRHAAEMLRARGVEVLLGATVERVTAEAVELADGTRVPTRTLLWAAGVRAHPLVDALGLEKARAGRIVVGPDLAVPGHDGVWAIGDVAAAADEAGNVYPQLAPVAMQGARHVAAQIERRLAGRPTTRFRYVDKGTMATIGRRAAVAQLPLGLRFTGTVAWLLWLFLHLVTLIGFRNRASVLLNWAWSYVTYDRAARIILQPPPRRGQAPEPPT